MKNTILVYGCVWLCKVQGYLCKLKVKDTHHKAVECTINMLETKENKDQPLFTLTATKSLSKKDNQIKAPFGKLFNGMCPTQAFTMRLNNKVKVLFSCQILKKTLNLIAEMQHQGTPFSSTGTSHTSNSIFIFF